MNRNPGRVCPLDYRYGAKSIAAAPATSVETLYVVGGLYGNPYALAATYELAEAESGAVTLCFNGDFNWFNIDDESFCAINKSVLQHSAIQGNVEFELGRSKTNAGCGCAYPASVSQDIVDRSNRIHERLQDVARNYPHLLARLSALPLFARYDIGSTKIAVMHGDAESLAGWAFDAFELDIPGNQDRVAKMFTDANVDIFAATHTCLPVLRWINRKSGKGLVANNGAAGMPNFRGQLTGLLTRISVHPSPHRSLYQVELNSTHISAIPIPYDSNRWSAHFLKNWPPGTDAYLSYFERISTGPEFEIPQALGSNWQATNHG